MGCYGYTRDTTPFLDYLSNEGCIFKNVTSTTSWTSPAIASLFTSLVPSQHGVRHGVYKEDGIYGQEMLDESHTTIAEALKEAGFVTLGISSNLHLSRKLGFAQGFDHFIERKFTDANDITNAAIKVIVPHIKKEPYFLWVHYFDPHWPYINRKPWINDYAPDYQDEFQKFYQKNLPQVETRSGIKKNSPELQNLIALYDSEINYADVFIKKLLHELPHRDNSMIIILSDHGESFLEHNTLDHGFQLFEESIHIPLIITLPDIQPVKQAFDTPCSIVDVPLTILDWLQLENRDRFQGQSLLPFIAGETPDGLNQSERFIFSELNRFNKDMVSLRTGRWKYINYLKIKKERLYDLTTDPYETNNIVREKPSLHSQMKNELEKWLAKYRSTEPRAKRAKVSDETAEKLKSLGYIK